METLKRRRRDNPTQFLGGFLGQDPLEDFSISRTGLSIPAVNVAEDEQKWTIEVGAPGLCKEDYDISIHNDVLTIKATRQSPSEYERQYSHKEFQYSDFEKSFSLPNGADISRIAASCKDGLLNVDIPKKDEYKLKRPRHIDIS